MRILVLVNDFPNENNSHITNIFVKEQVRALAKFVDEINVVVPIPIGIEIKRKIKYRNYDLLPNTHIWFLRYFNPMFPLSHLKFNKQRILFEYRALRKFIRNNDLKFDLIHAHYTWPSGVVAVELKKKFKTPVVITEHTHISLYPRLLNRDPLIINTWKRADTIIRVNKKDIPWFKKIVPSVKFVHILNGYNPDRIRIIPRSTSRKYLDLPINSKILFNLAGLFPYKGHKYLIDAMSLVIKEQDDVVCFIGGSGPLKRKLETQIKILKLENHVKLLGFVPDDEVAYWMNAADLFVLPSLSEGNPTVMFEALGVGLPFIGTAVGGIPEVITLEDYGFLCEPANPKELAEKILRALDKKWDREKIREYAKQFTWENITKKILKVYNMVIE